MKPVDTQTKNKLHPASGGSSGVNSRREIKVLEVVFPGIGLSVGRRNETSATTALPAAKNKQVGISQHLLEWRTG